MIIISNFQGEKEEALFQAKLHAKNGLPNLIKGIGIKTQVFLEIFFGK